MLIGKIKGYILFTTFLPLRKFLFAWRVNFQREQTDLIVG